MSFLSEAELRNVGFKSLGENVLISKKASIYNPKTISIGSNVRIDDFCILSGSINIGNYIHISAYCGLYGKGEIELQDFSGLSPRCTLLSVSDDFQGDFMIGPMVNAEYTNVQIGKIIISKYVQIGAGSIILPGVCIGEGSAIGAMSLVKKDIVKWKIYGGNPIKYLKPRKKSLIALSKQFIDQDNRIND